MNNTIEIDGEIINIEALKHKKGRKSKKDLLLLEKIKNKQIELGIYKEEIKEPKKKGRKPKDKSLTDNVVQHKKRGRKPKGGKIVLVNDINKVEPVFKSNIILHLKCSSNELQEKNNFIGDLNYTPNVECIEGFNDELDDNIMYINNSDSDKDNKEETEQKIIYEIKCNNNEEQQKEERNLDVSMKDIWTKLKKLQYRLKNNMVTEKKSNCFWCTCKFENLPIYIPKYYINNNYEVYGCFCSPECACAHLCNEKIDASTRWERYSLLNSIYSSVYNYKNNIKPAPNPHYILDKFYGNMTIEEYRALSRNNTTILVVDKPLTKILPEVHSEVFETPNISMNNERRQQNIQKKYRLARNKPAISHNNNNTWTTQ